jgi:sigma-B regulation protein RsbU (phosphoserine phosphatase)
VCSLRACRLDHENPPTAVGGIRVELPPSLYVRLDRWIDSLRSTPFDPPFICQTAGSSIGASCVRHHVDRFFSNERRLAAVTYELETAREIQASILPKRTPLLEGVTIAARYIPMTEVGGDFYDFLVLDEKHAGILVADVSGHGVPAALVASMVKVGVSAQAEHAGDPARVLHGINQSLCGKMERAYVTAMYVFLDLERGVLLSANAGHPPLIIRPGADSGVRQFCDNGLPLGLFAHATYENTEAPLGHGDRVVMYTDGIVEATDTGGEFFGDARFYDFIDQSREPTAEMFADQLIQHLKAWSVKEPKAGFDDDVTLIVIDV